MADDLLANARRQAEKAEPSTYASALLQIARAESGSDVARARATLLEGLEAVRKLPSPEREHLLGEGRLVAAAVAPELLGEIPASDLRGRGQFASGHIVQAMIHHGHVDAAFDYLLQHDSSFFPFGAMAMVLHRLDRENTDDSDRRLMLVRRALEIWRQSRPVRHPHVRNQFVWVFSHAWKKIPEEEASVVAHAIVEQTMAEPDVETSSGYPHDIHFSSNRQNTLFRILHVLRHLDPALAQSLVESHDQLRAAARIYPNGMETMQEEAEAEAKRRGVDRASCGGGYFLGGDPSDFDRQRRLIDDLRAGDFVQSIEDALEKYREDASPDTGNAAPKYCWPSTGELRRVFYQAGKRMGVEAAALLERIPDDDVRLFASIELAASLAGVPEATIVYRRQSQAPRLRGFGSRRMPFPERPEPDAANRPTMRSPDGSLIRCPKCSVPPSTDARWSCKCGHRWNTFWTAGLCPACKYQWEVTQCPSCGEMSEHRAWYVSA